MKHILAILAIAILTACKAGPGYEAPAAPPASAPSTVAAESPASPMWTSKPWAAVYRVPDPKTGATCYVVLGGQSGQAAGISCVRSGGAE